MSHRLWCHTKSSTQCSHGASPLRRSQEGVPGITITLQYEFSNFLPNTWKSSWITVCSCSPFGQINCLYPEYKSSAQKPEFRIKREFFKRVTVTDSRWDGEAVEYTTGVLITAATHIFLTIRCLLWGHNSMSSSNYDLVLYFYYTQITIFVNLGLFRHFETVTNIRTWIKSHWYWRML